ncbi:hypothetical protein Ancab_024999 [Ancistrocladus abbreviatus]
MVGSEGGEWGISNRGGTMKGGGTMTVGGGEGGEWGLAVLAPLLDVADDTNDIGRQEVEEEEDGGALRNMALFDWGELVAKVDDINRSLKKTLLKKLTKDDDESECKVSGGVKMTTLNEMMSFICASSPRCPLVGRIRRYGVEEGGFARRGDGVVLEWVGGGG